MALGSKLSRSKKDGARKDDGTEQDSATTAPAPKRTRDAGLAVARVRTKLAQLVWALFLLAALVLAVGALLIAIGANRDNSLVSAVLELADSIDLGVFSRENGIREFEGSNAETKNALFNWGLGAVAYLVVGRLVERIIKP